MFIINLGILESKSGIQIQVWRCRLENERPFSFHQRPSRNGYIVDLRRLFGTNSFIFTTRAFVSVHWKLSRRSVCVCRTSGYPSFGEVFLDPGDFGKTLSVLDHLLYPLLLAVC